MEILKANNQDCDSQTEGKDNTMNYSSYDWPEVHSWISKQSRRNCLSDIYHTVNDATFLVTFFPSK